MRMQLTLISTDRHCQQAVYKAAKLLNAQVTIVADAHDIQMDPGDIILWHLTDSSDAIAVHLLSFGRPLVLLVTRQQMGRLGGGSLLRDPLPSLPEPIWYIILPF